MKNLPVTGIVAVIGAGTMGTGIAQVAASAGHRVLLYDAAEGAAAAGKARLETGLSTQVSRGKIARAVAEATLSRIEPVSDPVALEPAALVIEAIIEDLGVKQTLFAAMEDILGPDAILATNTSSLSITSIAAGLRRPGNVVGMHFFNPAPIMKLVEVVSGVATDPEVAAAIHATATTWGKVAVHTRSTPGFIVNRVARGYYGEPLRLLEEGVADIATLDAVMTQGAGFRMGPFALMDLIGHDVNFSVSRSVFEAYFHEPRFRPSLIQQELVNAGYLGRKSGRGFYNYANNAPAIAPATDTIPDGTVPFDGFQLSDEFAHEGIRFCLSDGRLAAEHATVSKRPTVVFDLLDARDGKRRLVYAASPDVTPETLHRFTASLAAQGIMGLQIRDWPGLVVLRTIAVIANEAFEAVLQGVADEAGVDNAMRFGVNYPKGPMAWAREIGLRRILSVLESLYALTGDTRYRASMGLRMGAIETSDQTLRNHSL